MIQTRTVIRPTRNVRDLYLGRKFKVTARFPGGREIPLGHAQTRGKAFEVAQRAARPQTSYTANGSGFTYTDPSTGQPMSQAEAYEYWRAYGGNGQFVFY